MKHPSYGAYVSVLYHFWRENWRGHYIRPWRSGASKPDQKVEPLGGPFGPTAISKLRYINFQGQTPPLCRKCLCIRLYRILRYQLTPLSYLCDGATAVLREISDGVVNTALKILSQLGQMEEDITALQDTTVYHIMQPVETVLDTFKEELVKYKHQLTSDFSEQASPPSLS